MKSTESDQVLADVVVGSRGCLHERWLESFYPEDIPEEWLLGFYANEFNTLLVPWSQWGESVEGLKEGLDDTQDDFHLYLELPANPQALPVHLSEIEQNVKGLLCTEGDAALWQAEVEKFAVTLYAPLVEQNDVLLRFAPISETSKVELVLVDSSNIDDLAMMREQLEIALQGVTPRLDFIFTDNVPDMEAMQNTSMIAELLGA